MMTIVLVSAGMLLIWQVTTKQVIDNKCGDVGKNAKIENEYLCIKNDSREKVDNSHYGRDGVRQSTTTAAKYEGTWANGLQVGFFLLPYFPCLRLSFPWVSITIQNIYIFFFWYQSFSL